MTWGLYIPEDSSLSILFFLDSNPCASWGINHRGIADKMRTEAVPAVIMNTVPTESWYLAQAVRHDL